MSFLVSNLGIRQCHQMARSIRVPIYVRSQQIVTKDLWMIDQ